MPPEDDTDPSAVEEARRTAAARREALLALSASERLRLVADLCLQGAVLPRDASGP